MGIQSLKSAIFIVSAYIFIYIVQNSKNYSSVHEIGCFRGRKSNFCIPIHQNL